MSTTKLVQTDFEAAAQSLACEIAAIKAVCDVEAPRGGFLPDGRLTILFERHKFHALTSGRFDQTHPNISSRTPGGYGAGGAHQWERFSIAYALDAHAAMRAASWGRFQILGSNYHAAGFDSPDAMISAFKTGEAAQLIGFVNFVKNNGLDDELRRHDWSGFARGFNGANYKINRYDVQLRQDYQREARAAFNAHLSALGETAKPIMAAAPIGTSIASDIVAVPDTAEADSNIQTETVAVKSEPETGDSPVEIKASQPSLFSRLVSFGLPGGATATILAIWKFVQSVPPWGWGIIGGVFAVVLVVSAWLLNESLKRADGRTHRLMDAAMDRFKNTLKLI